MKLIFKITLFISLILAVTGVILYIFGNEELAKNLLVPSFIALALGLRGMKSLKGFAYPVMIVGVVSTALIFPDYFIEINGFKTVVLITPLIQLIMFGMGTTMSFKDFAGIFRSPKGVFIGVLSQFLVMPILGFTLASLSAFPAEIAAGIILIGCSPSGVASNVMVYISKGNLALAITITSVTTLLAPLLTPILMKLLAGSFIEINVLNMMWNIIKMVILPIGLALVFNEIFGRKEWLKKVMPLISMFGIAYIIVIVTALGRDSLLKVGPLLILIALIHNVLGYNLGYWMARLFKMNERDCRTIAIEVGMQNASLAKGLAYGMGKLGTVGLAPMVFGPIMNITGSILASYWRRKTPNESNLELSDDKFITVPDIGSK